MLRSSQSQKFECPDLNFRPPNGPGARCQILQTDVCLASVHTIALSLHYVNETEED